MTANNGYDYGSYFNYQTPQILNTPDTGPWTFNPKPLPRCEHCFNITYGWTLRYGGSPLQSLYCSDCGTTVDFPVMWKLPTFVSPGQIYLRRIQLPPPVKKQWERLTGELQPDNIYKWKTSYDYDYMTQKTTVTPRKPLELKDDDIIFKINWVSDTALKWVTGT